MPHEWHIKEFATHTNVVVKMADIEGEDCSLGWSTAFSAELIGLCRQDPDMRALYIDAFLRVLDHETGHQCPCEE